MMSCWRSSFRFANGELPEFGGISGISIILLANGRAFARKANLCVCSLRLCVGILDVQSNVARGGRSV